MNANEAPQISIVFSADTIDQRVRKLAGEIAEAGMHNLLVVAVLKGSFIFAADLLRALHDVGLAPEVDFITLSSYRRSTQSSGQVEVLRDIDVDVQGRHVLLVDDILESGRTLAFAKDLISARGAADIKTCVLLKKPSIRVVDVDADFHAFDCPDVFVVGYGMDVAYRYRQLPFVGQVIHD